MRWLSTVGARPGGGERAEEQDLACALESLRLEVGAGTSRQVNTATAIHTFDTVLCAEPWPAFCVSVHLILEQVSPQLGLWHLERNTPMLPLPDTEQEAATAASPAPPPLSRTPRLASTPEPLQPGSSPGPVPGRLSQGPVSSTWLEQWLAQVQSHLAWQQQTGDRHAVTCPWLLPSP